jgi:hypothetical protein
VPPPNSFRLEPHAPLRARAIARQAEYR